MSVTALLLGTPRVRTAADERPVPATLPGAVLVYLAARGSWVGRDEVALVFRPDASDAEARRALRKLLFRARGLGIARDLEVTDTRLRWPVHSDLLELRRTVAEQRWAQVAGVPFARPFDGFSLPSAPGFEAWLELERAETVAAWRRALLAHARAREAAGDTAGASAALERLLEHDPLDEIVVQDLMRVLEAHGDRSGGLAWYQRFAARLAADVGVQPLDATMALADALRGRPAEPPGPPADAAAALRGGVQRPATPFIGRADTVARLASRLRSSGQHLVSIVGFGGVGKTRLALELVSGVAEAFPGGVVEVSLAGAADEGIGALLGPALGVAVGDADALHAPLAARSAAGRILLLLDQADALEPTALAHDLAALLGAVPRLSLVLTATRPLGLASEHVVALEGLELPGGDAREAIRASPAVRLFLQRAARADPGLVDDDATLAAVARICRALDGHPLAIELAAAWTRSLGVAAIADQLAGGADLLRTDAPDVPERHRNVGALVARAWDDLGRDARAALQALLAFRGPWSLDAARAVAGADVATVVELVARALVRRRGTDRFEVLRLVDAGAPGSPCADVLDRHASFVLSALAELAEPLRSGSSAAHASARALQDDLMAAWRRALELGRLDLLEPALEPLDTVLHARSDWRLARAAYLPAAAMLAGVTTAAAGARRARLRARILARAAAVERNVGDTEAARRMAHDALAVAPVGTRAAREARLELAKVDEMVHAYPAAESGYRAVLADQGPGEDDLRASAHTGLSNVLFAGGGDVELAMRHADDAVAAARRSGDLDLIAIALVNLGAAHYDLGRLEAAERRWQEAADAARRLGNRWREASILANLAAVAERRGDAEAARSGYERVLAVRDELGDVRGIARALLHLGRSALAAGDVAEADVRLEGAVHGYESVDAPADLAWALATHARVRLELGDAGGAERRVERALRLGRLARDETAMLAGLLAAAALDAHRGRTRRALDLARTVERLADGRADGIRTSARERIAAILAAHPGVDGDRGPASDPVGDRGPAADRILALVAKVLARPGGPGGRPSAWNGGGTPSG